MSAERDYDAESRDAAGNLYAYDFDFGVMHPFMMRAFEPYFRPGPLLELGSFRGDLTARLLERFSDVTCVEASSEAAAAARLKIGERARIVASTFDEAVLPRRHETAVMTHVLEHLDDPVATLTRVRNEWLLPGGRLMLTCPNAHAASRRIAVKMGLIPTPQSVTPAEADHGHRRTYCLETLEHDVRAAGFTIIASSGIFFKALANFQWDRLLKTDIISKEYLEGCYLLGIEYPDLCASVFIVAEAPA